MTTDLTLRGQKGSPLTTVEMDANFTNLRTTADGAAAAAASLGTSKADITYVDAAVAGKTDTGYVDSAISALKDGVSTDGNTLAKLRGLISAIETLIGSDDINLDSVQEIVDYIKANRDLIDSITVTKVNVSDIVAGLTSTSDTKVLAASQGKALNDLITALTATVNGLGTASTKEVAASGNASATQVVMGNDTRLSDARPASDVSAWAKAATKPSYTATEVGAATSADPTFTGKIKGDLSNATFANRLLFQNSVANSGSHLGVIPSGTGNVSSVMCYTDPTATNGATAQLRAGGDNSIVGLYSSAIGTGTFLPLGLFTSGLERLRVETNGDVKVKNSSGNAVVSFSASAPASAMTLDSTALSLASSLKASVYSIESPATLELNAVGGMMRLRSNGSVIAQVLSTGFSVSNLTSSGQVTSQSYTATGNTPYLLLRDSTNWASADASIQVGVNAAASGVGDYMRANVPTGKRYNWTVGTTQVAEVSVAGGFQLNVGSKFRVNDLGSISGTRTLDLAAADQFNATIAGATTFAFSNAPGTNQGQVAVLRLTNAGSAVLAWPAGTKFVGGSLGTLTTSGTDILFVHYDAVAANYVVSALKDVK